MHREKCSFLPSREYLRLDTFDDLEKVFIPSPLRCPMMFGSMGIWIQLLQGIQSLCNCNKALAYTSSSWWAVGFALALFVLTL